MSTSENAREVREINSISVTKVREEISQIVNKTCYGKSRTKFTRHGKAVAAIVPMEDLELLVELEAKVDLKKVREALVQENTDGSNYWEKIKSALGSWLDVVRT